MSSSKIINIRLPILHPAQQQIADSTARFKVVCCGRRFGKTLLAIDDVVNRLLDGQSVGYYAPTNEDLHDLAWQPLLTTIDPIVAHKNETRRKVETITGGVFRGFSMEKERPGQGRKFHHIIVDEAATVGKLKSIFDETIRATLLDYVGSATFFSTPRGYNDFWGFYQKGSDPLQKQWAHFHFTSFDNPYMDVAELREIEAKTPLRTWQQEYLAEFTADGGAVFRGVSEVATLDPFEPYDGEFIFGIDWGRVNDFTAISIMDVNTCQQVYVERFNQIGWTVQYNRLIDLYKQWRPYRIIAEENSIGDVNIPILARQAWAEGFEDFNIEGFQTTAVSKPIIIDDLTTAIERRQVTLQNDDNQLNELNSYALRRLASGRFQYSAPEGGHDDTVIATALSWHGVTESGRGLVIDVREE
jgi:hypothetical protein